MIKFGQNRASAFIICLIIIFIRQLAFSQAHMTLFQNNADSVHAKLRNAPRSEQAYLYNQLAFHYSFDDFDSSFFYANKAMELALERKDMLQEGRAFQNMGNAYCLISDYRQSVFYLEKALGIFRKSGDRRAILEGLSDLSLIYYNVELYDRMRQLQDEYLQILERDQADKNPVMAPVERALATGLIAISYRETGEYEKGIALFREYMKMESRLLLPKTAQLHLVKSFAEILTYDEQYDSALKYTLIAREYLPKNKGKTMDKFTGYEGALGNLYFYMGDNEKAISYLSQNLAHMIKQKSNYYGCRAACNLGDIYRRENKLDSAYFFYRQGMDFAENMFAEISAVKDTTPAPDIYSGFQYFFSFNNLEISEHYYSLMVKLHRRFYRYFKEAGKISDALFHHEQLLLYTDSLSTVMNNLEVRRTQLQFASEQVKQENTLLQQDNELKESQIRQNRLFIVILSAMALFIIIIVIALFRQSRMRNLQEKILLEQRLLRTQMNPHFIFNSLASIQNFIFKKDDIKAGIYLSRFSELVRSILDNSLEENIPLEKEISTIENYLSLQQIRFPDKLDYTIDIDPGIDIDTAMIPPMLAQPFIENSIEHGIKHKEGKGRIEIRIRRTIEQLNSRTIEQTIFEVEDNGVGREKARDLLFQQEKNHKSLATAITRERIAALNRKTKEKISLEIIDLKDQDGMACGTLVKFTLPLDKYPLF